MAETTIPEFIDNISGYLKTTNASGLLLHTSRQPSPYSDFDFYIVFDSIQDKKGFVRRGKEHAQNVGEVMPARLVLNWATPGGVAQFKTSRAGITSPTFCACSFPQR